MKIRFADRDDVPLLLSLYRQLGHDEPDAAIDDAVKNLEMLKRYPGSHIVVGCIDETIVATCTLVVIPNLTRRGAPYALIENVVTDAAHRNRGYGKAVLTAAIDEAWRAGCYKVMLLTGRSATLKFYQDAGFEPSKTGLQIRRPATPAS